MRKQLMTLMILLTFIGMSSAVFAENNNQWNNHNFDPDKICRDNDFDHAIDSWDSSDFGWLKNHNSSESNTTHLYGDSFSVFWHSEDYADGVISFEDGNTIVHNGGQEGIFHRQYTRGIEHVIFCVNTHHSGHQSNNNNNNDNNNTDEVPEFGVIAGALALVGAVGIFVFRRKK